MAADRSGIAAVVRNRPFVIFALTQAVSLLGDKVNYMALLALFAWFASAGGTDPGRSIAAISVVAALPAVMFAPVAGVVVDRVDHRRLMLGCDATRAALVGLVPTVALAAGALTPVFALAFLVFLGGLLFNATRMSVIPRLVGAGPGRPGSSARLVAANSFLSFTGRAATLGGMVLGGLAVDWNGWQHLGLRPPWSSGFYLDALTYLVSVAGILLIYRRLGTQLPASHPPLSPSLSSVSPPSSPPPSFLPALAARLRHTRADIAEAWRYAGRTPPVLFVYGAVLALILANTAFLVLYVPTIQGSAGNPGLNMGTRGVGFAAAIGATGLLLSSVGYGLVGHRFRREHAILAGLLVLGGIGVALPFVNSFALVALLAFLGGVALTPTHIAMDTMLHETVPPAARGRVFSNREWVTSFAFGASALAIGLLTRHVPGRRVLLGVGLLVLALAGTGFIAAAAVRRWHAAQEVTQ